MLRTKPLITPEELQCLLGAAPVPSTPQVAVLGHPIKLLHFGLVFWLVKGIFLYAVLTSPSTAIGGGDGLYLGMRCTLELACVAVFWAATRHPNGRSVAHASLLVATTSLIMDAMTLLTLTA